MGWGSLTSLSFLLSSNVQQTQALLFHDQLPSHFNLGVLGGAREEKGRIGRIYQPHPLFNFIIIIIIIVIIIVIIIINIINIMSIIIIKFKMLLFSSQSSESEP